MSVQAHHDGVGFKPVSEQYPMPIKTAADVKDVTLTLDTNAYADGDVLGDLYEITDVVQNAGETVVLQSLVVNDRSDQGVAFDLYIFDRTVTMASKNAAWAVSDDDMDHCLGVVQVSSFIDAGGNRQATIPAVGLVVKPNATSLFIGTRSRGAGTYAADGLKLKFGFI